MTIDKGVPGVSDDLQAGQRIFIRLRGSDLTYMAEVLEISARALAVTTPCFREKPLECRFGDELVVLFAANGRRYMFGTRVMAAPAGGRMVTGPPAQTVPVQERANVRQAVGFTVELTDREGRVATVPAINLSSGGLQVLSDRTLVTGYPLKVSFTMPGDPPLPIAAAARVVWMEKVLEEGRLTNRLGLEFVKPAIWQQDEIFRHIFRRMVEDRQTREGAKG